MLHNDERRRDFFTGRLFDQTGDVFGVRHVLSADAVSQLLQHDAGAVLLRDVRRPTVSGLQHGRRGEDLLETGRQHVSTIIWWFPFFFLVRSNGLTWCIRSSVTCVPIRRTRSHGGVSGVKTLAPFPYSSRKAIIY